MIAIPQVGGLHHRYERGVASAVGRVMEDSALINARLYSQKMRTLLFLETSKVGLSGADLVPKPTSSSRACFRSVIGFPDPSLYSAQPSVGRSLFDDLEDDLAVGARDGCIQNGADRNDGPLPRCPHGLEPAD